MTNEELIAEINYLIELSRDAQVGNLQAVDAVQQPAFAAILRDRAREHEEFVRELENIVVSLGGEPSSRNDATGDVQHAWLNIQTFKNEGDINAVIEECVQGEKITRKAYEKVLKKSLPDYIKRIVQQQADQIEQSLERTRDLRNTARNVSNS